MRLVIIESPYAGEVERNTRYARACLRDSLGRGEAPIASHLLYTQPGVLDDLVPAEREQGIAAGLAWRSRADGAVFYTDLGWSRGMLAAREVYDRESRVYDIRTIGSGWAMVSAEEIKAACTGNGGWTKEQLAQWGVPWPPPKGWRERLEGRAFA